MPARVGAAWPSCTGACHTCTRRNQHAPTPNGLSCRRRCCCMGDRPLWPGLTCPEPALVAALPTHRGVEGIAAEKSIAIVVGGGRGRAAFHCCIDWLLAWSKRAVTVSTGIRVGLGTPHSVSQVSRSACMAACCFARWVADLAIVVGNPF